MLDVDLVVTFRGDIDAIKILLDGGAKVPTFSKEAYEIN